jgi:hypothetical protein
MLAKKTRKLFDNRSRAATGILSAIQAAGETSGERFHHFTLDPEGAIRVRIRGEETEVGRLTTPDGWPFEMRSFEELEAEAQNDR